MLIWIIFIVSLVASTFIVNRAYQLYMNVIGASGMFYSGKKKLITILVVALVITTFVVKIFGIAVPR